MIKTCKCDAYLNPRTLKSFPHRWGSGKCLGPEYFCPTCGTTDSTKITYYHATRETPEEWDLVCVHCGVPVEEAR